MISFAKKIQLEIILAFLHTLLCWGQKTDSENLTEITFETVVIASDDGLQSWENIDIFYEDDEGIMWSVINDGIYRYNGHTAINVSSYLSKTHNLDTGSQSGICFLKDDDDNIIWYGGRKGLYKIDMNTLTSTKIFLEEPLLPANWRNFIIRLEHEKDTLYVGTANGLYLIDKQSNKVLAKYLTNGRDFGHRESSNAVQSIYPTIETGAIWVVMFSGLYRIDKINGRIEQYTLENAPYILPHNFFKGHLYENTLLLPSWGLGIVKFDLDTKKFSHFETRPDLEWDRADNVTRSVISLNDSISLTNAARLGNALFNRHTNKYQWLDTPNEMKNGVFLNVDRSGYVWASKRGRIFRTTEPIVKKSKPFRHIIDVTSFRANDVLISRPAIDGYTTIELNEGEKNIDLTFAISKPHILKDIQYEYRQGNDKWVAIHTPNNLKLFDLKSGTHIIGIRAKGENDTILADRDILFNIHIPFFKSIYFIGISIFVVLTALYLLIRYINQQKITKKLRELDTLKSNFFANISHEFRTPLTLIANPIEQALQDMTLPDKKREQFVMAKRNSDRLLSLVNQLLDLSKLDAGHLKLHIQKSNITQLISALADAFTYQAKQKQLDYAVTINQTNQAVYFDKDAVEKIVVNLLSNAIKYTPENGSVVCNADVKNQQLHLEVKNSGIGLTEEALKNIFQRFYQTSEDHIGSGIGLALVKELVDLHKGVIAVDSKPGAWTTFTVTLPVNKNSYKNEQFVDSQESNVIIVPTTNQDPTDTDAEELTDSNQPILLIVEDNTDVRTLLKQTFNDSYHVLTAENGQAGIDLALEHIPDIIISDIMMPVKDGIELANTLKNDERTSHVPLILLTAKAGDENKLKGIQIGADDYLTKPFNSKILTTKVAKLIETRQQLQNRYSQELVLMPKDIAVNSVDEQFLEKVQAVLDEKLVESSFSIDDFSKAVGMSRMQLHRKIKAITGLSAGDFIRSQRLKLAAQLLKKSDINVAQVGYTVGFNDHSYFTKRFKRAYKCTPTAYAKKHS